MSIRGNIVKRVLISEDAVSLVEKENKIIFIVDLKARKSEIKKAVEGLYEVQVEKVNVQVTPHGEKKAYVKLKPEFSAADLAVKLGIF